jgi:hypothetical protein
MKSLLKKSNDLRKQARSTIAKLRDYLSTLQGKFQYVYLNAVIFYEYSFLYFIFLLHNK